MGRGWTNRAQTGGAVRVEQEREYYLTDAEAECLLGILAELLEGQESTHTLSHLLAQLYTHIQEG